MNHSTQVLRQQILDSLRKNQVLIGDLANEFGLSTKKIYQILQSERASKRAVAQKKTRLRQKLKSLEMEMEDLERRT